MILHDRVIAKTRQEHRCFWCGESIRAGRPARSVAGKWDGDFSHACYHPECYDALNRSSYAGDDDTFGEAEHTRGTARDEDPDELRIAIFRAGDQ